MRILKKSPGKQISNNIIDRQTGPLPYPNLPQLMLVEPRQEIIDLTCPEPIHSYLEFPQHIPLAERNAVEGLYLLGETVPNTQVETQAAENLLLLRNSKNPFASVSAVFDSRSNFFSNFFLTFVFGNLGFILAYTAISLVQFHLMDVLSEPSNSKALGSDILEILLSSSIFFYGIFGVWAFGITNIFSNLILRKPIGERFSFLQKDFFVRNLIVKAILFLPKDSLFFTFLNRHARKIWLVVAFCFVLKLTFNNPFVLSYLFMLPFVFRVIFIISMYFVNNVFNTWLKLDK